MPTLVTDLQTVQIDCGQYIPSALSLCRDLIAGYTGDYFVFAFDSTHCVLVLDVPVQSVLIGDIQYLSFSACEFYMIEATLITHTVTVSESGSVSGSSSGSFYGFNNSGSYSGGLGGDYQGTFVYNESGPVNYQVFYYSDSDGFELQVQSSQLCFSSVQGYPHLVEGVSYYAYYQVALFTCCVFFVLISRLFKHIS